MALANTYRPGYDRDRRSIGERRASRGERGAGAALRTFGAASLYAALALVFAWQGVAAFTAQGAQSVALHALHSPLTSWVYAWAGVQTVSIAVGVWQLVAAGLILARFVAPLSGAIGAAMALVASLVALSFLFTTPGGAAGGFVVLAADPGRSLLGEVVLVAASLYVLGDCLVARLRARGPPGQWER